MLMRDKTAANRIAASVLQVQIASAGYAAIHIEYDRLARRHIALNAGIGSAWCGFHEHPFRFVIWIFAPGTAILLAIIYADSAINLMIKIVLQDYDCTIVAQPFLPKVHQIKISRR